MEERVYYLDLTDIRRFYYLILYKHNASYEEVYNYLQSCLKFVFDVNNLNIKDYNVVLHSVKKMLNPKQGAYMYKDKKPNEYHVHFYKDSMVIKGFNDMTVSKLLEFTLNAMHEFGHIIQYIINPTYMSSLDYHNTEVYNNVNEHLESFENKQANLVVKQFLKHQNAMFITSKIEKDANIQSYDYFKSLISALMDAETDENLICFYEIIINYINRNKKYKHVDYRVCNKENKEALNKLKALGFTDEMLLI